MQRALSCCVLAAATAATLHGSAKADELQSTGVEGGFFLFSEQEAAWTQSTPEAARTSVRLGYGIQTPQFNVGFEAGHRFINGVNAVNRTDWSLMLEGAWVPKGTSLEIYGEYAPAWVTETGNEGLQQEAKWGLLIPLSGSANQSLISAKGLPLPLATTSKLNKKGRGRLAAAKNSFGPVHGWAMAWQDSVEVALEKQGQATDWSDAQSPHTDAAGLIDVVFSTNERWELFLQYEPRYRFQAEQPGLVQILKAGLVFNF